MTPAQATELQRGHVPHSARSGRPVPFFRSLRAALDHLRDHVRPTMSQLSLDGWRACRAGAGPGETT